MTVNLTKLFVLFVWSMMMSSIIAIEHEESDGFSVLIDDAWQNNNVVFLGCIYRVEHIPKSFDLPLPQRITYVTVVKSLKGELKIGDKVRLISVVEKVEDRVGNRLKEIYADGELVYLFIDSENLQKVGNVYECEVGAYLLFSFRSKDFISHFEKIVASSHKPQFQP